MANNPGLFDEVDQVKKVQGINQVQEPIEENHDKINKEKRILVEGLTTHFRNDIERLRDDKSDIIEIIASLNVREINELLFDTKPTGCDKSYVKLIEDLLEKPLFYYPDSNVRSAIQDGYLEHLTHLLDKVQSLLWNGETNEDDVDNKTSTAAYLEWRLTSLIARSQLINFMVPKVGDIGTDIDGFRTSITVFEDNLNIQDKKLKEQEEKDTRSFQNMLSTMGVFTSIVVIVMSLVITSSSWLNSADASKAMMAFIIPSCVAVLAVCALTALVIGTTVTGRQLFNQGENKDQFINNKGKEQNVWERIVSWKWWIWIIISLITMLTAFKTIERFSERGTFSQNITHHVKYVFKTSDWVKDFQRTNDKGEQETVKIINLNYCFRITTETGEMKEIEIVDTTDYLPEYDHDGFLHYCTECNCFE